MPLTDKLFSITWAKNLTGPELGSPSLQEFLGPCFGDISSSMIL